MFFGEEGISATAARRARLWLIASLLMSLAACRVEERGMTLPTGTTVNPQAKSATGAQRPDADTLLQRVLETYRDATTYRDRATVSLSYREGGQRFEDRADIAVALARPNRIHVKAYQVEAACDGKRFHALVRDPGTRNLDGQVLTRPAPAELSLAELIADPLLGDQLGNALLDPEGGRNPPQLELLLAGNRGELLSRGEVQRKLVDDAAIDGHSYYRLDLETKRGTYKFWVDPKQYLVRRIEYPRSALIAAMADSPDVKDVQLVADFTDARMGEPISDSEFEWKAPADTRPVRFFVPPPQPLPSQLFGQAAGDFRLAVLPDGASGAGASAEQLTKESLAGKIAVLLWFRDHPACEGAAQQLNEVRKSLDSSTDGTDANDIVFYAVSTEPSTVSDAQIRSTTKRWNVELPVARDRQAHGRDLFQIEGAPTLVVLDKQSRIQVIEVGANPNLRQELPGVLKRLREGADLAAEIVRQHQREVEQYERQLAIASGESTEKLIEIEEPVIAPEAPPKKLKLIRRWTNSELTLAGNLFVAQPTAAAPEAATPRILAIDDGKTITELNLDGELVARHTFALPDGEKASILRAASDRGGAWHYAIASLHGRRCVLLDSNWNQVATYPPDDVVHEGIRDVQLSDIDGDGKPECAVAFWGLPGVHLISMNGHVLWTNRRLAPAVSLAIGPARGEGPRDLFVSGDQGTVMRIDSIGRSTGATDVSGWTVHQLFAARFTNPADTPLSMLAENRKGQPALVSLNTSLREQWSYPLPPGTPRVPVERITSGYFFFDSLGAWAIAGLDGSVHLVSADGAQSDHYFTGEPVQGLALLRHENHGIVVVSLPSGITAWESTE